MLVSGIRRQQMTTSPKTGSLDHPAIRELVNDANSLPLADRLTLLKGLVPAIATEMAPEDFERLIQELRLKGERFYEATSHPKEGRATRHVMGERDVEGR
jgi:hypothetical protein